MVPTSETKWARPRPTYPTPQRTSFIFWTGGEWQSHVPFLWCQGHSGANTPLERDPGKSRTAPPWSSEQQVSSPAGVEPSIGAVTAAQGILVHKPWASCFISSGWRACPPPVHSLFLLLSGRAPSPVNPKSSYINRFLKPCVQMNKQCQLYMDNSGWVVTTAGPCRPGLAITHNNERMLLS